MSRASEFLVFKVLELFEAQLGLFGLRLMGIA